MNDIKRFRKFGYARTEGGYSFPGIDKKIIS